MNRDSTKTLQLDRGDRSFRYYRNAVERHWDPGDIDLSGDVAGVVAMAEEDPEYLDRLTRLESD